MMRILWKGIFLLIFFISIFSKKAKAQECENVELASYYQSSMVLQKDRATVWGYSAELDQDVSLQMDDLPPVHMQSAMGEEGRPIWSVTLEGTTPGGPHTITVTSQGCSLQLDDVMIGDVWFCVGQRNMEQSLSQIFYSEEELEDMVNYPDVRTVHNGLEWSDEPQYDVLRYEHNWQIPTAENMVNFSAVCWLYGKRLYDTLQYPVGLVASHRWGTVIEAWSSPTSLEVCYGEEEPPPRDPPNQPSQLWNTMVHPYLRMTIYGLIWYQGESNSLWPDTYVCLFSELVQDYRSKWSETTDGATPINFPFGMVQIGPGTEDNELGMAFPELRWSQTAELGYMPNPLLPRVFMAGAMDLPDFESPYDPYHPRHKHQIADRLSLGASTLAYGLDVGRYQGPYPTDFSVQGENIVIEYDNGTAELDFRDDGGFEVCCVEDEESPCRWEAIPIIGHVQGESEVRLHTTGACDEPGGEFFSTLRYAWRETPCELERCALYSVENELPAPPVIAAIPQY